MNDTERSKNLMVGLLGALAGGVLGHFVFLWAAHQRFYAMILPGALVGLGGGLLVRNRSVLRGVLCAVIALGLSLFTEWRFAPFIRDPGLGYFLAHVHQLRPISLLMMAAGTALGYYLAVGKSAQPG